jgi:hypothetical protein
VVCPSQTSVQRVGVLMFLVYGDESLDASQDRVCAVGALVGTEEAWIMLEAKWKALHGSIPFHANDCDSDHGDYAIAAGDDENVKHRANKELYRQSVMLLAQSEVGGFASAYDLAAQRESFPAPYAPPVYYQPFLEVLEAVGGLAHRRDGQVELTFDSRIESDHNAGLIYAHIREAHPENKKIYASKISFESSRQNPRIQVADLFAREAMKDLDNEIGPKKRDTRKSWSALRETGRFSIVKRGREHFADSKNQIQLICGPCAGASGAE